MSQSGSKSGITSSVCCLTTLAVSNLDKALSIAAITVLLVSLAKACCKITGSVIILASNTAALLRSLTEPEVKRSCNWGWTSSSGKFNSISVANWLTCLEEFNACMAIKSTNCNWSSICFWIKFNWSTCPNLANPWVGSCLNSVICSWI